MIMKKFLAFFLIACMMLAVLPAGAWASDEGTLDTDLYSIGEGKEYATITAARAKAEDKDGNGAVTYVIYGKVDIGSGWVAAAPAGVSKVYFIGNTLGDVPAELTISTKANTMLTDGHASQVAYEFMNLTCSRTDGAWVGNVAHANKYFTALSNTHIKYTNCKFPNGACSNMWSSTEYINCEFTSSKSDLHALWIYAPNVTVKNSSFTGYRGIKTYAEAGSSTQKYLNTVIDNCSFNNITDKPAIIASHTGTVTVTNSTISNCPYGWLANETGDNGIAAEPASNITINGAAPEYAKTYTIVNGTSGGYIRTKQFSSAEYAAIEVKDCVANIGDTYFSTLALAFSNAEDGDIIYVKTASDIDPSEHLAEGLYAIEDPDGNYIITSKENDEVTVTFDGKAVTTNIGGVIAEADFPADPSKKGFAFKGWVDENGNEVTAETEFYADATVTSQWVPVIESEEDGDIIVDTPEHNVTTEGADIDVLEGSNVTEDDLEKSAKSVNVDENTIQDVVTDNIDDIMDGVDTKDDKNYIVKTTIDVELESYKEDEEGNKDLELDITPKYEVYETDSDNDNPNNIPENQEPVKSEVLEVTEPVKIRVDLPAGFEEVGKTIYITHDKGDGEVYIYSGIVQQDSNGLFVEFINPNGFSPFNITNYLPDGVAIIENRMFGNLATALNNARNGDTIEFTSDDDEYIISREIRFILDGDFTGKIIAGRGYEVTERNVADGVEYEVSVYHAPMVPLFFGTTVRVYDAANGTITPNGIPMIIGGMTKTFKFIPDEGFEVADVIVNGQSIGAAESYTIDGWQGYVTLTAVFEEIAESEEIEP